MRKKQRSLADWALTYGDIVYGAMLLVITGLMPLIVRIEWRSVPPDIQWLVGSADRADAFGYWKAYFIFIPVIIMCIYFLADHFTTNKRMDVRPYLKRVPMVMILSYLAFMIISAIVSSYTHTSWFGTFQREEGAFMWLGYVLAFIFAMFYVRNTKYAKPLLWGLCFSSIIMGIVGVSQLIGRDLFDQGNCFFQWAINGIAGREVIANGLVPWLVTFRTAISASGFGTVFDIAHGTLFNPNTFGKYTAMMAPVLLVAGIFYSGRLWQKALLLIGGVLMLVGIFASSSLGGLVGVIAATGTLVVTFLVRMVYSLVKKTGAFDPKQTGIVALGFGGLVLATVLALLYVPQLNQRVTTLFARLQEAAAAEAANARRFNFDGNNMYLDTEGGRVFTLTIHHMDPSREDWKTFVDAEGNAIVPSQYQSVLEHGFGVYVYDVPEIGAMMMDRHVDNYDEFRMQTLDRRYTFVLTLQDGNIYARRQDGATMPLPVPSWGFNGREAWGSGRGFIWSRTFPMMPRRAIIGSGPDTFVNVFPNHDVTGRMAAFNHPGMTVDKAHNIFLQAWITTGGISAILLYGLFVHYLLTTLWSLVKSINEPLFSFGLRLGLLAGVAGFVMASMATDSTTGSTGIFFVLLGMGYGLNYYHNSAKYEAQNAAKPNN